jgi:hypothetical protein
MAKRATIGILAGLGAMAALFYATRIYAEDDVATEYNPDIPLDYSDFVGDIPVENEPIYYGPDEAKGAGLFPFDYMGQTMNYKVNEYPKYAAAIVEAEQRYGLPTDLLARLLYQESRYRTDIIAGEKRSGVGATGIAQFMPRTGEEYGLVTYSGSQIVSDRRLDPFASIDAAGRYLRALYRMFNDWKSAIMAYNWGPGNVAKFNRGDAVTVPMETSTYVAQITADVPVA